MAPSRLGLDWLLVISCTFSILLAIVYLFYSNRILAALIGYALRLSWWNDKSSRVWVSLESFQVSLLAGRLMIKDLRYHSSNQTFRAIKCHVTWRYWIWRARTNFGEHVREKGHKGNAKSLTLPCRLQISLEGVEWLLYNRTAAYNNILIQLQQHIKQDPHITNGQGTPISGQSHGRATFASNDHGRTILMENSNAYPHHVSIPAVRTPGRLAQFGETLFSWLTAYRPDLHELLPVGITAHRGAIVLGNPSTPCLLVAKFLDADGSYSVGAARSSCDPYKTMIDIKFENIKIDLEKNAKYRGSLVQHGKAVSRRFGSVLVDSKLSYSVFTDLWTDQNRRETQHKTEDIYARTQAKECKPAYDYAIAETILEAPAFKMSYYWDEPGEVPMTKKNARLEGLESHDVGNGDLAPQYGIDCVVYGGTVRYGPWADRQRVELQRLFFPPTFQNVEPTALLKPGDKRMYTELKVFFELYDTATFHIPFKEPSKDWQFDEAKFPGSTRKKREGGWLEVHASGHSTISYIMPWVATSDGYDALAELHLDEVTVLSSVNDIKILTAPSSRILCELPTPLRWNEVRRWVFNLSLQKPTFHVIRDHVNLFTDLGKDWGSGPPTDFDRWIPMHYLVNISLQDFELNLFLNDHNIITHPHARNANTLLTLRGANLRCGVEIPLTVVRPRHTKIPFWVEAPGVTFNLTLPKWNTHAMFATSRLTEFGHVELVRVDASFLYHSDTRPEFIDRLTLDVFGRGVVFKSFGWVVRHLMTVRDNYFGNFIHFSTLSEYVDKRNRNLPISDPVELKWREGKSNVFEVSLSVKCEDAVVVIPAGFLGYEYSLDHPTELQRAPTAEPKGLGTCVVLRQPELQIQLRNHDYSMEVSLNISPVTASVVEDVVHSLVYDSYQGLGRQNLHVDGINIVANRLFGPQPRTSTYLCLWEIQVGAVSGEMSTMELRGLSAALTAFRLNFSDNVNAPASEFALPSDPDVTFLKVSLRSVDVAWLAGHVSIHVSLPQGIHLDHTDLAGNHYKKVTEMRIKQCSIRALIYSALLRESWLEAGSISFDIGMAFYASPGHWREAAERQLKFVAMQDALTRRARFLYDNTTIPPGSQPPSAYCFSMFLPRPNLPQRASQVPGNTHPTHASSPKSRIRHLLDHGSESDENEHISEADRDARLAHSRPTTPLLFNEDYDSRSISSSDESDDDGITTDMSESDSDSPEPNVEGITGSLPVLSHYKHLVRRFECHLHDKFPTKNSSLFSLSRDGMPVDHLSTNFGPELSFQEHDREEVAPQWSDDATSMIRLVQSNSVDVLLTPLILHVMGQVSEEFFNKATSMELLVDSLTTTYLNDVLSENKTNVSVNKSDIEVSTFRLRILQSLRAVDEELITFSHNHLPPQSPSFVPRNARTLSDFTLTVHDLSSTVSQTTGKLNTRSRSPNIALRSSFSRFDVRLYTSTHDKNRFKKLSPQCAISFGGSTATYTTDNFHVTLGTLEVRLFGNVSPAMMATTADSMISVIQTSQRTYQNGVTQSIARRQGILWSILQYSKDLHVGDPLTQTQPSFLVQVGCPLRLRLDASWKLFMYLRHCLRHLNPTQRKILQQQASNPSSLPSVKVEELYPALTAQLHEWGNDIDWEEMERLPFLRHCFYELKSPGGRGEWPLSSAVFHSRTFLFAVVPHPTSSDDGLDNTISFEPMAVTYRLRKGGIVLPVQNASPAIVSSVPSKAIHHHNLTADVESINIRIHPTFISFLQNLLHLHGRHIRQLSTTSNAAPYSIARSSAELAPDEYWDIFVKISTVSTQAAVQSMILEVGFDHANLVIPLLQTSTYSRLQQKTQRDVSTNCSLTLSQVYTRVRQAQDKKNPFWSSGRDILTSLILSSLSLDTSCRLPSEHLTTIKGLFTLGSAQLNVPRSALLTYRLIEEWRTQYLPYIHSMTQELLADLENRRRTGPAFQNPRPTKQASFPIFDFQVSVKRVGVSLQVMHGTWFSWSVHDILIFLRNNPGTRQDPRFTFGVQLASQLIRIGAQSVEDGLSKTIKLILPSFRSSGHYDNLRLRSHAIIDHFSLTLKPRYMDDILVVQQNLGTHFYDILDVIAENRKNRPAPKKAPTKAIKYDVAFMLQGFRVGIVGPTTILDLTSARMTGTTKNESGLAWDFAVSNLALALSHHTLEPRLHSEFDRKLRSAYMVLDLKASSSPTTSASRFSTSHILRLQIGRMHAVMSPNSIGELGDLVDHFQAEKILRQEQRAQELEEIKKKTERVMKTFKVERPTASLKRSTSLLENRTVLIDIADIGIAFPLALRDEIEVDPIGTVPAFLMSIQKAAFSVKRHESGQASMGRLSFQFIKEFDQSRPSQFDGDQHQSRNRLLYPGMKAEFQSGTSTTTRQWQIGARVDGFILDLDPSIVDNVFGLMDVYHRGRERVERLTTIPETSKFTSEDEPSASIEASYLALKTSQVLLVLVFQTGKVRLRDVQPNNTHIGSSIAFDRKPSPTKQIPIRGLDDSGADVIYFPTLTVWGEYRAAPAASKLPPPQDQEPSVLIFRSQLHSTTNQINPSLFPFLAGFSQRIEERLTHAESEQPGSERTWSEMEPDATSHDSREFLASGVWNGIQLSFSLSIDSSRLELVCGHDLGVVAALHWESGGFLVTLSPRARIAYFSGSVNGLQVDLRHIKHQGGIVRTAHLDARNLGFSVSYSQTEQGIPSHSLSVVVDTEFGAALRLDRLQDILIFKAVYIDRLPGAVPQSSVKPSSPTEGLSPDHMQGLSTVVLLRARHIKLSADLGHNVASVVINLESLILRSRMVGSMTDVSLSIAQTNFDFEEDRPLAGYMRLPDFSFSTVRRNNVQLDIKDGISQMLLVRVASGVLDIVLQSEKRTILQYHTNPFDIRIADDWTAIDWNLPPEERTLRLDFSVVGTDVLAIANLQTIPKIIILLAKLKADLQAQEKEAINALAISSITHLPRPNNALSEVAEAMIRSARSKSGDGPVFSYIIVQHMTLKLSNLRFALFKNPNDTEMAMFQGRDVNAELQRVVQEMDMPPTRTLKLAFSALNLSKYSSLKYRVAEDDLMAVPWLERLLKGATEATIARVPAMNLEMNSDVEYEGRQEVLQYDLVATAEDRVQTSQSIYVSLNLSLYLWAGALVKGLGVEIDKAWMSSGLNRSSARATAIASSSPLPTSEEDTPRVKSTEGRLTPRAAESVVRPATITAAAAPASSSTYESETQLSRKYFARSETSIDYGTIQQLGEATPDAKAPWLGLKETVPPRVHEYATLPMEILMKMLLEVYIKQLKMATKRRPLEGQETSQAEEDYDGLD